MATKTVVCPECDAPLAPGRLACSSCGTLVATVASSWRPLFPPDVPPAPEPAGPPPEQADADAVPEAAASPVDEGEFLASSHGPLAQGDALAWPRTEVAVSPSAAPPTSPSWPDQPAWPPVAPVVPERDREPLPTAEAIRNPAGAYLPPSAVLPPAEALPLPVAASAAGSAPVSAAASVPRPAAPGAATATALGSLSAGVGGFTLPSNPVGGLVAAGSGLAALGFLLPWADVVLGSGSYGSFLDRWGLAGPGHPILFGLLIGLAVLAAFSHRLPRRIGTGLPAVALGCMLLGLVWPYLFGPFGATVGVYVVVAGALLVTLAGAIDLTIGRHARAAASV